MKKNIFTHPIQAVLFDFDGTLIRTPLDFSRIRQDLNENIGEIDPNTFVLEYIESLERTDPVKAERARKILDKHEEHATQQSVLKPYAKELFDYLGQKNIKKAVVTRNSRTCVELVMDMHQLSVDAIVARDFPFRKPRPEPLEHACTELGVDKYHSIMVGDYGIDIEAGNRAGIRTVLILDEKHSYQFQKQADICIPSLNYIIHICELANWWL